MKDSFRRDYPAPPRAHKTWGRSQERPTSPRHPDVLMSFQFKGLLDRVYCSLVVQMYHMDMVKKQAELPLWRDAAEFETIIGKKLGIELVRPEPGTGRIDVYFDKGISVDAQASVCKYVERCLEEHQNEKHIAGPIQRLRHYLCSCGQWSKANLETKKRLFCSDCGEQMTLGDELEKCFESEDTSQKAREQQQSTEDKLDNESKERVLVGEVISAVARAGQISREKNVSDHGIDMEIEFKDQNGHASGQMLYLQLKSGDSHLRERADGTETFRVTDRHAKYWAQHAYPVMLVIRNSQGQIRWMEISDYLKRESDNGRKPVTQIQFKGEPFTVASILARRNKILPP